MSWLLFIILWSQDILKGSLNDKQLDILCMYIIFKTLLDSQVILKIQYLPLKIFLNGAKTKRFDLDGIWITLGALLLFYWRVAQVHSQKALRSGPVGYKKSISLPSFHPTFSVPFSANWHFLCCYNSISILGLCWGGWLYPWFTPTLNLHIKKSFRHTLVFLVFVYFL